MLSSSGALLLEMRRARAQQLELRQHAAVVDLGPDPVDCGDIARVRESGDLAKEALHLSQQILDTRICHLPGDAARHLGLAKEVARRLAERARSGRLTS